MTRTITTADLAPLVTRHGADFETSKWTVELGFPASEPVSIHSWQADLLAAIPSAPVPVVSDAAVARGLAQSAAGETVDLGDFTQYLIPGAAVEAAARAMAGVVSVGKDYWRATARLALRAAIPHLAAVPSATREDVEGAIYDVDMARGEAVLEPDEIAWLADGLLARFTITQRTDR